MGGARVGGARVGAGAPKKPRDLVKTQIGLKLPTWIVAWLREQPESASVLIEQALRAQHGIAPPALPVSSHSGSVPNAR